jgi:hypothetical protein
MANLLGALQKRFGKHKAKVQSFESDFDTLDKINELKTKLQADPKKNHSGEFFTVVRQFFRHSFKIKYQFTYDELKDEISKRKIDDTLKKEVEALCDSLINMQYANSAYDSGDLQKQIELFEDIATKVTYIHNGSIKRKKPLPPPKKAKEKPHKGLSLMGKPSLTDQKKDVNLKLPSDKNEEDKLVGILKSFNDAYTIVGKGNLVQAGAAYEELKRSVGGLDRKSKGQFTDELKKLDESIGLLKEEAPDVKKEGSIEKSAETFVMPTEESLKQEKPKEASNPPKTGILQKFFGRKAVEPKAAEVQNEPTGPIAAETQLEPSAAAQVEADTPLVDKLSIIEKLDEEPLKKAPAKKKTKRKAKAKGVDIEPKNNDTIPEEIPQFTPETNVQTSTVEPEVVVKTELPKEALPEDTKPSGTGIFQRLFSFKKGSPRERKPLDDKPAVVETAQSMATTEQAADNRPIELSSQNLLPKDEANQTPIPEPIKLGIESTSDKKSKTESPKQGLFTSLFGKKEIQEPQVVEISPQEASEIKPGPDPKPTVIDVKEISSETVAEETPTPQTPEELEQPDTAPKKTEEKAPAKKGLFGVFKKKKPEPEFKPAKKEWNEDTTVSDLENISVLINHLHSAIASKNLSEAEQTWTKIKALHFMLPAAQYKILHQDIEEIENEFKNLRAPKNQNLKQSHVDQEKDKKEAVSRPIKKRKAEPKPAKPKMIKKEIKKKEDPATQLDDIIKEAKSKLESGNIQDAKDMYKSALSLSKKARIEPRKAQALKHDLNKLQVEMKLASIS